MRHVLPPLFFPVGGKRALNWHTRRCILGSSSASPKFETLTHVGQHYLPVFSLDRSSPSLLPAAVCLLLLLRSKRRWVTDPIRSPASLLPPPRKEIIAQAGAAVSGEEERGGGIGGGADCRKKRQKNFLSVSVDAAAAGPRWKKQEG